MLAQGVWTRIAACFAGNISLPPAANQHFSQMCFSFSC